ncbi:hypothetical protein GOV14_06375 [Candidatus Pacearchaeota archaeon]|nr:hypothetical protein [Candidatus Pacearchaeota archaeon]
MVTNKETTVKVSRWLVEEIDKYVNKNMKNASDFPSKRNFVDRAIMLLLEEKGVKLDEK